MALGGPSVAPSTRSWLGVARELTVGTPVSPTNTIPMDAKSYSPEDTPKFLPDEAIRGSMAMLYEDIIGPADATFSFGGPAFLDTHGFFLDNIFGDLSTTGTVSAGTSTSFSGSPAVGATVVTVGNGTTFTVGQNVQIDTGSIAEVVTLDATASTSIGFGNNPLRFAHGASGTVFTVVAPFTHTFALLNSQLGYGGVPGAQPPTLTLTDNTNLNYGGTPGTNTVRGPRLRQRMRVRRRHQRQRRAIAGLQGHRELVGVHPGGGDPDEHDLQHHPAGQLEIPAVCRRDGRVEPDHHER